MPYKWYDNELSIQQHLHQMQRSDWYLLSEYLKAFRKAWRKAVKAKTELSYATALEMMFEQADLEIPDCVEACEDDWKTRGLPRVRIDEREFRKTYRKLLSEALKFESDPDYDYFHEKIGNTIPTSDSETDDDGSPEHKRHCSSDADLTPDQSKPPSGDKQEIPKSGAV
ncbi:hypothetical protein EJ06DRAFT_528109 [Trichodelitschia bisporula]|uniref:Uncharacterized protein n=1 Tax=Trichodelitschia bisporula TaxID=703511 RepID=A0A6G1I4F2_9PEZI|nr:hypothetical protein EJ06DRAFT_528109 [Trichodelitschia bisporula]